MANDLDKKIRKGIKIHCKASPRKNKKKLAGQKVLSQHDMVTGRKKVAVLIFRYPEINKPKIKKLVSSLTVTNKNRGYYS